MSSRKPARPWTWCRKASAQTLSFLMPSPCSSVLDSQMKSSQTSISPSARCEANRREVSCKNLHKTRLGVRAKEAKVSAGCREGPLKLVFGCCS